MSQRQVRDLGGENVAWYCQVCGRQERPAQARICRCGQKMQRCSRYEWFLIDELQHLLTLKERDFRLHPQYPLPDRRGFIWYFDIFVWVNGASRFGGSAELIEINGPDHARPPRYRGPGRGYTRDDDKYWAAIGHERLYKQGIEIRTLTNAECAKRGDAVYYTAIAIVDEMLHRADTWL